MWSDLDTIAAIATPRGVSALAVIRVSGNKTQAIIKSCFKSKDKLESKKLHFGYWGDPIIDQITLIYYDNGHGFTGEEALEIICHGNPVVAEMILTSILDNGARAAMPGEFSYRAVMNEKIDLAQAENILKLIHAKSPLQAKQALENIRGRISETLEEIDDELVHLLAHVEATIDFSSEDISPMETQGIIGKLKIIDNKVNELIVNFERREKFEKGLRIVLVGEPNAGKSSLFNRLIGKNRSIVASQPGTTRDTVEVQILINQIIVTLVDTAGLRESIDSIELEGIARTKAAIQTADIILHVKDGTQNEVQNIIDFDNKPVIICRNKSDLNKGSNIPPDNEISISCINGEGIENVFNYLSTIIEEIIPIEGDSIISTKRQRDCLFKMRKYLSQTIMLMEQDATPIEFISLELKSALEQIRIILGKELNDDVMDRVFKEFCIGK